MKRNKRKRNVLTQPNFIAAYALIFMIITIAYVVFQSNAPYLRDVQTSYAQTNVGLPLKILAVATSSHDGNKPENVIDNDYDTRWSAEGDGQWISMKLDASQTVSQVSISFYRGNKRVQRFKVETSGDNQNWNEVFSGESNGQTTSFQYFSFSPTVATYVRVVGYGNTENEWNSIKEVRLFNNAGTDPAKAITVTAANHDEGHLPSNTLDNEFDTRWSGYGKGAWITYDFKNARAVNGVAIAFHRGSNRVQKFEIELSLDNQTWEKVYAGQSSGRSSKLENFTFPAQNARYLKIVGMGNTENDWNSLLEVIFLDGLVPPPLPTATSVAMPSSTLQATTRPLPTATARVTPTTRPTVTITSRPTQAPITAAPVGSGLPSQVLNLTNWKITLPTGSQGKPTEIKQPSLASFKVDPWFVVLNNAVRFRAPVNGVTTSGSSYPRSELREMANNGTSNAAWSSTSGKHTMYIDQAITAVPKYKKHVVAGQIHDGGDDVTVFRLEDRRLFINVGNGESEFTLDDNYTLGKRFNVKFEVQNGVTKYYYNGNLVNFTLNRSFTGAYFKAGAYTQSNCAREKERGATDADCTSNNYGEVVIYDLQLSHQ